MPLEYEKQTLDNGLDVIVHVDRTCPIIAVNLWYHVGSKNEQPGRTGFAHLFEHLMFMGSQHVATGDFDIFLEAAGATNNGSTTEDRTNYYEDGPSNTLPLMLYLDSDRMGFLLPEIDSAKVDLQRGVVQNERRQSYENRPYGMASENILSRLYPADHPYSWPVIGSMADLSAATLDDVREFFRRAYAPNNASIVIAGDIDPEGARKLVEKYFGEIPAGPEMERPAVPDVHLDDDIYHTMEDRVQLPRLYNAWHAVKVFDKDEAALEVLAGILTRGKPSRLYRRLVYDLEIATRVTSFLDNGRLDGMFQIYATARRGHDLNEIQTLVDEEVRQLAESGPTERELQRIKNQIESQFLSGMERVGGFGGKANRLNQYSYFAGEPDYFSQDLERYVNVTAEDVMRVAQRYLVGANRVVLSVVPRGKTELAATRKVLP